MKTQIIQLDVSDDFISIRDKMGWNQTGRILLVWPNRRSILNTRLDLVLLRRHCTILGAQLALVCKNSAIRFDAESLGIPVFNNPIEAQTARWRSGRHRKLRPRRTSPPPDLAALRQQTHPTPTAWLGHPAIRWGTFLISIMALLALAVFILPAARLTLTPKINIQAVTVPVTASNSIKNVNLAGELPAHPASVVVEGRDSLPATGSVQAPLNLAIGGVKFTNLIESSVQVQQGTVVSTLGANPLRFATNQDATVPAGIGKSIIVPITAFVPGKTGNLPADSLVAVEGDLGLKLSASNPMPTHGGVDSTTLGPSSTDRMVLANQLTTSLQETALAELQANLPPGDFAITTTLEYVRTLEETFSPAGDEPADQLDLILRLEFQALVVSAQDLRDLVTPILDSNLPAGFLPIPDTLSILSLTRPILNADQSASWTISARRSVQADIPHAQAVQLATGLPLTQASQRLLDELPLAKPPDFTLQPSWWPRIPFLPMRIDVLTLNAP